jgi:hypothetical protein
MKTAVLGILLLAAWTTARAAATKETVALSPNPEWCKQGYRCLTIAEYADMTVIKIHLETDLAAAKAKARWLGCVIGAGVGISGVATVDYSVKTAPAAHLGVTCGLRF